MGLFSNLFGQKSKDEAKSNATDQFSTDKTKTDFTLYEETVNHITISEALQTSLKLKLKQAFEDPKSFYDDDNEFKLSERGLTYPEDVALTPKFVLIDTMQDEDQMAEVDWKEDEDEIRYAINRILEAKNYASLSSGSKYDDNETFDILNHINDKELKSIGYSLEILDIDSDSYVFTIVPLEKHQEVATLFSQLK
ncbi:hypothetical protein PQ459_07815 [Chryseobacterium sp. KACC 21268]|nr:hypothetical protein PQ459_07815 [Chryseobacterium sp. KACC 21268]